MKAYMESPSGTLARLETSLEYGLTQEEDEDSRRRYGANRFTEEKQEPLIKRIFEAASEPMIVMLILAAIITLGVNIAGYYTGREADFLECVGIFATISLSCVITVVMEGRSAKAFETLKKIGDDTQVKVLRGGEVCLIARCDVVVEDILFVETGDKLAADGRILEKTSLMADESALTGGSMPVRKDAKAVFADEKTPVADRVNMLYSGCFITGGSGKIVVAAVPEGLPTIVAVSLAVNIIKMSKQNALVKKMIACETIGCINVVCSDKTGTLTENRMTVKAFIQRENWNSRKI